MGSGGHRRRGVTVIELVVVMSFVGLMSAMALPSFTRAYNASASRTAADVFVRTNELARATAVRFGRVARLHIDASQSAFWLDADTSGTGQRAIVGGVRRYANYGLALSSSDTLVCFDTRGLRSIRDNCQSGPTTVVFSRSERADTVQITSLGKLIR